MTVKELTLQILSEQPSLTNQQVADQVRAQLNSDTTAKNIAWYKWKFSLNQSGELNEISNLQVTDEDLETVYGDGDEGDEEEIKYWSQAEHLVVKYEKQKGAKVEHISRTQTPGYDVISTYPNGEQRYIEVKSKKKGKMTWLNLTSNETTALMNEPQFWLYILEGDISTGAVQITEVSRIDLLKAVKIKMHGRVSNLSGYKRNIYEISK